MATSGPVEPNSFDVIVLGTGLPEALLAAAAAAAGQSVLHLDPHDFYGAHWTSLNFTQFSSWAAAGGSLVDASISSVAVVPHSAAEVIRDDNDASAGNSTALAEGTSENGAPASESVSVNGLYPDQPHGHGIQSTENSPPTIGEPTRVETDARSPLSGPGDVGLEPIELEHGNSVFSGFRIREYEGVSLGASRSYSIDLSGPKLTFCASHLVDLLLRSGASHYVEFKGVDASYIWTETGISAVPSSRADVFKDRSLSLPDKRYLMRFFNLVTVYAASEDQSSVGISAEDLDGAFVDFMQRQHLPSSIQSIILYAIALVNDDQQHEAEDSSALLTSRDGLQKLALYLSSVARYPNAPGAFLYPLYGQGELPQAFCRSAAVNGALYVLRRPVTALLVDRESKDYKGIRTAVPDQVLFSKRVIMGPTFTPTAGHSGHKDDKFKDGAGLPSSAGASTPPRQGEPGGQVARCVCITDRSIMEGQTTLLVVFPPRSVLKSCSTVIRALQLNSAASVCPEDKYIVQLSTVCSNIADGQEALDAAVSSLFSTANERGAQSAESDVECLPGKPKILWSVFYLQALHGTAVDLGIPGVTTCDLPDETLDGEDLLSSIEILFKDLFPDKAFFPRATTTPQNGVEDADED